ncbi:MAG: hypothetical protein UY31_C0016G0002 [Candidatus Wolfebacteria bacterium GW2011_GWE1_48_7]|nr:MAG: hypothetical protein UY31_C0016G0002 [Candidatus Wolfebacteria bacterium GW2011_GWE1_48_7]
MDIFSHGLWAGAAAHAVNLKTKTKVSVLKTFGWGMFPDLFSFTIAFVWMFATGVQFDAKNAEPFGGNGHFISQLTSTLYNVSHSLVIFAIVFGLVWVLFKRPVWEMGGWLLHMLIDVPTHSYAFYPTPILWPISGWKFNGFSWGQPWFMALDIIALALVYGLIWRRYRINKHHGDH